MSPAAFSLVAVLCAAPAPPSLSQAAATVSQSLPEQPDAKLPATAVAALAAYRAALRDQADAAVAPLRADANAAAVKRAVLDSFAAQAVHPSQQSDDKSASGSYRLAYLFGVSARTPTGHPDLRAVEIDLGVHDCGSDTMLRLYRHDGTAWRPILAEQAGEIRSIADGLGAFSWALSGSAADGSFLALAAWSTPWCTSNWHTLGWRVWRVRASAERAGQGDSYAMTGEGFEARGDRDTVSLTSMAHQPLDLGRLTRKRILRFSDTAGQLVRREPVALDPADFLGEWVEEPWSQAARWSASEALRAWHDSVASAVAPSGNCSTDLSVERCALGERWHLVLESEQLEKLEKPCALPPALHFVVARSGNAFRVSSVSASAPDGCGAKR